MAKPFRAISATVLMLLMTFSVLLSFAPSVAAASTTWTSDTDFTAAGAGGSVPTFLGTQVIGTGAAAHVDLLKDSFDWANKNPSSTPGARAGPGMAFMSQGNETILFGGYNGAYLGDTWVYDFGTNAWTQITTTPSPPGREWPGLSYDPVHRVVVLFGGADTNGFRTDTWEFNVVAQTWSQQSPPSSPPPMADSPLAYVSSASRHILFGQSLTTFAMVTWAYNAATHTWADRAPSGSPSARSGFATAYSASRDRVVEFGGSQLTTLYSDTYEYDYSGNSWSFITSSGPSPRAGHSMTYRPADSSVYLFGGSTNSGLSQETWKYAGSWSSVGTANLPPPRYSAAFAQDTFNDVGVLFGGIDSGGSRFGDTHTLGASYRSAGKYESVVFDSGAANTDWQYIFWNKTTQPANTFLRFQIATSNVVTGPWTYYGNVCTAVSYYTTPGTGVNSCHDNQRYFRFLGDFGSLDTQQTPSMEDVTIIYNIPPSPPYIVITDPANIEFGVPIGRFINITFSKAMDPATVTVTLTAVNPPGAFVPNLTAVWSNGNTFLTMTHVQPFRENTVYRVTVVGSDTGGSPLVPNPADPNVVNPWLFVTEKNNPFITSTVPSSGALNVANNSAIVINFNEAMNRTSLVVTMTPTISLTATWSNGDKTVTLSHTAIFVQCTQYTAAVNATDISSNPLIPGPVPNPWSFFVACPNPFISIQNPAHLQGQVPVNQAVVVDFSEAMATTTVTFTISPSVSGTVTWTNGNTRLTWTHAAPFAQCGVYTVTIVGRDADENLPLVDNPFDASIKNPWKFVAICNNPYIVWTDPADGDQNVDINKEIRIFFSEQMDINSFQYTVTGGPWRETSISWDVQSLVHIQHLALRECTSYTVQVTQARSQSGASLVPGPAPNPWSFDTECVSPYVTSTDPANNETLVPVTRPIVVNFSAPMDTASFFLNINPAITVTSTTWSNNDQTVTIAHADFTDCTSYQALVDGNDKTGRGLLTGEAAPGAPNPWAFTTRCAGFYIIRTDPASAQTDVPFTQSVVVEFSEAANPATFSMTLGPAVGTLSPTWSGGNTIVTVTHSLPFSDCVMYTATVSAKSATGTDLTNVTGAKPNPWQFRAHCVPPEITSTNPANGATGVSQGAPIIVTFSETMNIGTVTWTIIPSIAVTPTWNGPTNTVLTLSHTAAFLSGTQYCVTIAGRDVDGNNLAPGSVPNPWCFTTGSGPGAPTGLRVVRAAPDIVLTWNPVPGPSMTYVVYSSVNKFSAWPWPLLTPTPISTATYVHAGADSDGVTHYYIVRALQTGVYSANSTMGFKVRLPFNYQPANTNIYWISLPYRSKYQTAKDISDELTSASIDVIGKWNPTSQSTLLWVFLRGAWRGVNFAINPGDGLYLGVRSSFSWIINGTDGSVPHAFTFIPPPSANVNWMSLPMSGSYAQASDLVLDIEGSLGPGANTKIIEVAWWDAATQSLVRFSYAAGGWTGTNFAIAAGDGIYFKVVSTFTWTPRLITPEVP